MVLDAMRIASTWVRPCEQRCTALTILLTSTDSSEPFRFLTCMTGVSFADGEAWGDVGQAGLDGGRRHGAPLEIV